MRRAAFSRQEFGGGRGIVPRELAAIPGGLGVHVCRLSGHARVSGLVEATAREFQLASCDRTLQVLDGHLGAGYGTGSGEDFRFYLRMARQEGILLDPTYTGKAFQGMLAEQRRTPDRFGKHILFLHTGGTFATFTHQEHYARLLGGNSTTT